MPKMNNLNVVAVDIDSYDDMIQQCNSCEFLIQTLDLICDTILDHTYHVVGNEIGTISDEELSKEILTLIRFRHPSHFQRILDETKRREEEDE